MPTPTLAISVDQFATFGDLLKHLRRRAGLTQRELSIAVGYSDAMISRLEKNQRLPDLATLTARFVPALGADEEPELVKRLLALATTVRREDAPAAGLPPFKGLLHFDEADAELFFGREALTERLTVRVMSTLAQPGGLRFLAIVGASGSGKSSVLRAGLLNALRWRPETAGWPAHVMTPTAHPLEALAASLLGSAQTPAARLGLADALGADGGALHAALVQQAARATISHILVVVDQFEELFTLCRNDGERRAFVDNLLGAAAAPGGPALVLLALRADFYAHCADYPALREALAGQQEYIGTMTANELRCAIEEPARRGRWELEPDLVDVLLHDLGAEGGRPPEPGALPLLSHALLETWERRRGHTLTLSGYHAAGGVRGAIAETAEAVFHDRLNHAQRGIARDIFLRLTELGSDETAPDTRRRVNLAELLAHAGEAGAVREVLTLLADARLITTEQEAAEVAHEALIREWPTLRLWLAEDRESLRLHRRLTEAALEWERAGRDEGQLYRGVRLAQAVEWAQGHGAELNTVERVFLDEAQAFVRREQAEREAQRQRELAAAQRLAETERARAESQQQRAEDQARSVRRLRGRNRVVAGAGVVALMLAVVAAVFGLQSGRNATEAAANLSAAQVASTQAVAQAATAAYANRLAGAERDNALEAQATADAASMLADEQRDAALAAEATAQAERNRADEAALVAFSRELAVQAELSLEADPERGILLALAALDQAYSIQAEKALHNAIAASRVRGVLRGHAGPVYDMAYSPDGSRIATTSDDKTARLWDAQTGSELRVFTHTVAVDTVDFTPDGALLVTADISGHVTIWDAATGRAALDFQATPPDQPLGPGTQAIEIEISPDGAMLATAATRDSFIRFWDLATGEELFALSDPAWQDEETNPSLGVWDFEFSPDGTRLAILLSGSPGGAEIWDIASRDRVRVLARWNGNYGQPSFSPDGARLAVARGPGLGGENQAVVFDVNSGEVLLRLNEGVNQLTFSADGRRLLAAAGAGHASVFDAETGRQLMDLAGHTGRVYVISEQPGCVEPPAATFEWCGVHLATSGDDGTVRIWDVSPGGQEVLAIGGQFVMLNEDRTRISTFDPIVLPADPLTVPVRAWDLQLGPEPSAPLLVNNYSTFTIEAGSGVVSWIPFFERGVLQMAYEEGRTRYWDLMDGGRLVYNVPCCKDGFMEFSSLEAPLGVGGYIATGMVEVWDLTAPGILRTFQVAEAGTEFFLRLSGDGERIVVYTRSDDMVRLWDTATGERLLEFPPLVPTFSIVLIDFSANSRWLSLGDPTGVLTVWDLASLTLRQTVAGPPGIVWAADITPDGGQLATNGATRRGAHVHDIATGEVRLSAPGGDNIRFVLGGRYVAVGMSEPTGTWPNMTQFFVLDVEELIALARTRVTRGLTVAECQQYLHVETCH